MGIDVFQEIRERHEALYTLYANLADDQISPDEIKQLIVMCLDNSKSITNVEDRYEVRRILYRWWLYLYRQHGIPLNIIDIDFDRKDRLPVTLTSRPKEYRPMKAKVISQKVYEGAMDWAHGGGHTVQTPCDRGKR